jgi:hypothetical protein
VFENPVFGTIGATHYPWNPNPQFGNWSMNNRSRVRIIMHITLFVLFGVTHILTESQETIPKGHGHRMKQIRSDHLVRSSWGGEEFVVTNPTPPNYPVTFGNPPKFNSPL